MAVSCLEREKTMPCLFEKKSFYEPLINLAAESACDLFWQNHADPEVPPIGPLLAHWLPFLLLKAVLMIHSQLAREESSLLGQRTEIANFLINVGLANQVLCLQLAEPPNQL